MDFGGYTLIVQHEDGHRETMALKADVSAPDVGDWVQGTDDRWYIIKLRRHPKIKASDPALRGLILYGVTAESLRAELPESEDDPSRPNGSPSGPEASPPRPSFVVLSFDEPRKPVAEYLPPALILMLVAAGYQEQSLFFERAKFRAWKLVRSEAYWGLEQLPNAAADQSRKLSREALFQLRAVENYVFGTWQVQAAADSPGSNVLDLAAYRQLRQTDSRGGR